MAHNNLTKDDLVFDYISLAKFTLPYLPYYKTSLRLAFPDCDIKTETTDISGRGNAEVFGVYTQNSESAGFYIYRSGDVMYDDGTYEWSGKSCEFNWSLQHFIMMTKRCCHEIQKTNLLHSRTTISDVGLLSKRRIITHNSPFI